jgi:hypothetical protein
MKTFEYNLIVESLREDLVARVNEMLEAGWFLYKGPQMSFSPAGCLFAQALKKPIQYRGPWD